MSTRETSSTWRKTETDRIFKNIASVDLVYATITRRKKGQKLGTGSQKYKTNDKSMHTIDNVASDASIN